MYFRVSVFVISFVILSSFQAYAGTATQTDWSGGDGIFGPVTDWGNLFYVGTDIECYITHSNIILQKTIALIPLEHTVNGDFAGTRSVHSADVNGDGYMDALGAAVLADDITWWDLTGYLPGGSLESSVLDVQESPDWQSLFWACTEPTGTSVVF